MTTTMSSSFFFLGLPWKGRWQQCRRFFSLVCCEMDDNNCCHFLLLTIWVLTIWKEENNNNSVIIFFFPWFVVKRMMQLLLSFFLLNLLWRKQQQCPRCFFPLLYYEENNNNNVVFLCPSFPTNKAMARVLFLFFILSHFFSSCCHQFLPVFLSKGITHFYGYGPLEKVKKWIWLFTKFFA